MNNKVQLTALGMVLGSLTSKLYRMFESGQTDGILFPSILAVLTITLLVFIWK